MIMENSNFLYGTNIAVRLLRVNNLEPEFEQYCDYCYVENGNLYIKTNWDRNPLRRTSSTSLKWEVILTSCLFYLEPFVVADLLSIENVITFKHGLHLRHDHLVSLDILEWNLYTFRPQDISLLSFFWWYWIIRLNVKNWHS